MKAPLGLAVLLAAGLGLAACGSSDSSSSAQAPSACRPGDPLANVYHPYRLAVHNPCVIVTGTVEAVRVEPDGDNHVDVALSPAFQGLLNSVNQSEQHGYLVVEIVPADEPGCTPGQPARPPSGSYDYGICTGANIGTPATGDCVSITGPHVTDNDHGWNEIHPAWAINVTGRCPADPTFVMPNIDDDAPAPPVVPAPEPPPVPIPTVPPLPAPTSTEPPPPAPATTAPAASGPSYGGGELYCNNSGPPDPHHYGHPVAGDHPCTPAELGR